ncbi:MAG: hypothetical protein HRU06_00240 [Oceanospirillaceae bacterium]|nr:hypothetical protein [Oceanospirillaceae bacterium]
MELQSAKFHVDHGSSAASMESGQKLNSAKDAALQLRSPEQNLEQSAKNFSSQVESTSVVTQIVVGVEAAVAVYGQLVSESVEGGKNDRASHQANTEVSKNVSASSELKAELKVEQAELKITQQLAARDREVKAHEQTHASIGGSYASAPRFDYTSGPDGRLYATSGEVSIDTSAVESDPQATLEKAQVIIRAALSVTEPSNADRQIAAEAKSLALRAMSDIREAAGIENEGKPSVARENQVMLEQDQLKREEFLAEQELNEAKREKSAALLEARQQRNDESIAVLKDYNSKINEIQETLRRLNTQLVDSGAFSKVFPEGHLINQSV